MKSNYLNLNFSTYYLQTVLISLVLIVFSQCCDDFQRVLCMDNLIGPLNKSDFNTNIVLFSAISKKFLSNSLLFEDGFYVYDAIVSLPLSSPNSLLLYEVLIDGNTTLLSDLNRVMITEEDVKFFINYCRLTEQLYPCYELLGPYPNDYKSVWSFDMPEDREGMLALFDQDFLGEVFRGNNRALAIALDFVIIEE